MGIRGKDTVVLAVERKAVPKLQEARTVKKILRLDEHLWAAFSGLQADARILLSKARVECQSHRLTLEDKPSAEYVARYIAGIQQQYTQKGGVRPFGLCCLVVGVDSGRPRLLLTEPSGIHSEWLACAIGRGSKTIREYLEGKVKPEEADSLTADQCIRLATEALLEVVQSGPQTMEVAVLSSARPETLVMLEQEQVATLVQQIEKERAEEAERKRTAGGKL